MDKMADVLDKLATRLGVSVEHIWPYLVKQTVVNWWVGIIISLLIFIAALVPLKYIIKKGNKSREGTFNDWTPSYILLLAGDIIILGASFAHVIYFLATISTILFPEAATIRQLMGR